MDTNSHIYFFNVPCLTLSKITFPTCKVEFTIENLFQLSNQMPYKPINDNYNADDIIGEVQNAYVNSFGIVADIALTKEYCEKHYEMKKFLALSFYYPQFELIQVTLTDSHKDSNVNSFVIETNKFECKM